MRKLSGFIFATSTALLAFALFACATTSIDTNKDAANIKPIGKTLIAVNTGDVSYFGITAPKVAPYLSDNFEKGLKQRNIEAKGIQLSGLELGENSLQKQLQAYGATTVMSIELTDGTVKRTTPS